MKAWLNRIVPKAFCFDARNDLLSDIFVIFIIIEHFFQFIANFGPVEVIFGGTREAEVYLSIVEGRYNTCQK